MKLSLFSTLNIARWIERAALAVRFQGKMGEGRTSPEAFASILAHPGESIFPNAAANGACDRNLAFSPEMNLHSLNNQKGMSIKVEFPTPARCRTQVNRRIHATVGNSCIAVQHLTKALFLSKPVRPPLLM